MDYSKLESLVKMLKTSDDLCGICHLSNNNFSTTLSCNHKYHWNCIKKYVLTKKYKSGLCPYCSKKFYDKNILKKCIFCPTKTYYDIKKCDKHINSEIKKCTIILKSGKNKNKPCNRNTKNNTNYCSYHFKLNDKKNSETNLPKTCTAVLKSGNRKGQMCNRKTFGKFHLCKLHYNYQQKNKNKEITI